MLAIGISTIMTIIIIIIIKATELQTFPSARIANVWKIHKGSSRNQLLCPLGRIAAFLKT